jgi:hypothetical protein
LFDLAFRMDTFQQHAGRLLVRVLRHELALKGVLEDRLAQPFGAL